ncbi:unnamed protein product [Aspergillus oryzae var. brunneus]|uniref:Unnamed protein product n=1 Tax=Aspergillus oryzae var. brunneus TaxID=332754 RepID=A0ABQ6L979_ASPOZ|nr:unnamed protein product [Aspergillus oryzae]GMG52682.1 unnamed protein product [Aspergillus oryzae var. brunneus]
MEIVSTDKQIHNSNIMTRTQIHKVAVIGAGISGVVSAGHLLAAGFDVTVFERNKVAGGVWYVSCGIFGMAQKLTEDRLYDERQPIEPQYPATKPSETDQPAKDRHQKERFVLEHAPPGNNVPTPLIRVKLNAWPEGTPDFVSHDVIKEYIQDTSRKARVDDVTIYGARVKDLRKRGDKWEVFWSTVGENDQSDMVVELEEISVSDIALQSHMVLVLTNGSAVSSADIAKEIGPVAKTVYQSTRNGDFDLPASLLPDNGVRIGEVSHFEIDRSQDTVSDDEPLPLTIHLKSGQKLCGIDRVIICTGYHITLPFLRDYHSDHTPAELADEKILVTDGTQVHNLHKDIFYIPDPTLAFIGVPYYTATFTLFEFQAIVATQVFAGIAQIPPADVMRLEYLAKIKEVGSGKKFHSLKDKEEFYVRDILQWVNEDRATYGLGPLEGHSTQWLEAKEEHRKRIEGLWQSTGRRDSGVGELPVLAVFKHCWSPTTAGRYLPLSKTDNMAPSTAIAEERAVDSASDIVQKAPKRKWVSYIWDTFDKSPEERRLMFKLDSAILTFASLGGLSFVLFYDRVKIDGDIGYFIKYLDQININNAFVSGM